MGLAIYHYKEQVYYKQLHSFPACNIHPARLECTNPFVSLGVQPLAPRFHRHTSLLMLESLYRQELSRSTMNCLDWQLVATLNRSGEVHQVQEIPPSDPCQTVSRPNSQNIRLFVWQSRIGVG